MTTPLDPEPSMDTKPEPTRSRRGASFLAIIAFGFLCVLAGAGVALLAPRLAPKRPEAPAVSALPPQRVQAPIAELPLEAAAVEGVEDVATLKAQIAELEGQGARSTQAAAAALAAVAVLDAAQGSRPFPDELASLKAAAPSFTELAALDPLAQTGAPSRVALALSFPRFAARAARHARKPADNAPVLERVAYGAARFVTLRRVESPAGPDARIAAAERRLADGDVAGALKELDGLPASTHKSLAPWRAGAERRAQIDRVLQALRSRVLRDLPREGPPA